MPLSRSVRNICEEPFFSGGVASLYLLMSSNVKIRRLSRAEKENHRIECTNELFFGWNIFCLNMGLN